MQCIRFSPVPLSYLHACSICFGEILIHRISVLFCIPVQYDFSDLSDKIVDETEICYMVYSCAICRRSIVTFIALLKQIVDDTDCVLGGIYYPEYQYFLTW